MTGGLKQINPLINLLINLLINAIDKSIDETLLDNITNIEKYNKLDNYNFTKAQVKECNESVGWKRLDKAKDEEEYLKILKEIQTNYKFPSFNQIYFHAGDSLQYQKYGYLKTRMLSYPRETIVPEDKMYKIYQ